MSNKTDYRRILMIDGQGSGQKQVDINYKELLNKYVLKQWPLYVLFLVVFLGAAYYKIKSTQPVYEISSKVFIKEKTEDYSTENDWVKKNLLLGVVSENVTNEIEVLSSFSLMHEVIEEMGLDVRYYWKKALHDQDAYKDFPVLVDTFSIRPLADEEADFELIVEEEGPSFQMRKKDELIGVYHFGEVFSNRFGTFRFQKNEQARYEPDAALHVAFSDPKLVADAYLSDYSVAYSDLALQSSILRLTLKDVIPERGEDLLRNLIEKYNRKKFRESNESSLKTLQFIDERLGEVSRELANAESNLERFKLNNNITAETTSDLDILLKNVNDLNKEQKDLEVDISIIKSMKDNLQNQNDEYKLIPINLSLVNVQIQDLIKPYNDLLLKRRNLLVTGQPNNPIIQSVNQDIQSLRVSINETLANMENDLALQLDVKQKQYEDISSRLRTVPQKERQLSDKSRTQSVTEDLYVYLLKKKEETSLALVNNFSNSNIVDPPRSSIDPVSPNKMLYMFAGLLGGLAFPFFLVLASDFVRDSVLTEKELKKLIPGVQVMGMINKIKGKEHQTVLRQRRDVTAEHFRAIRTKMQFHYRAKQKCIMVTSSISSEGKTFVAANLAMSYALSGKKTIILDFDFHRSGMGRYFQKAGELGLSEWFWQDLPLENIIQESETVPGLDFIISGAAGGNTSEILTDQKLSELFESLKEKYDIIIVDTPPVCIISDGLLLNKYMTNSVYVVRSGITKNEMLEKAKELFDNKLLVNPSLILNGVKKIHHYGYDYKNYQKYAS